MKKKKKNNQIEKKNIYQETTKTRNRKKLKNPN